MSFYEYRNYITYLTGYLKNDKILSRLIKWGKTKWKKKVIRTMNCLQELTTFLVFLKKEHQERENKEEIKNKCWQRMLISVN